MYPLPIPPLVPSKYSVFIPSFHLVFAWHLGFPPLDVLDDKALLGERGAERVDDKVHVPEALAVSVFLVSGEAVGDFPI